MGLNRGLRDKHVQMLRPTTSQPPALQHLRVDSQWLFSCHPATPSWRFGATTSKAADVSAGALLSHRAGLSTPMFTNLLHQILEVLNFSADGLRLLRQLSVPLLQTLELCGEQLLLKSFLLPVSCGCGLVLLHLL